MDFFIYIMKHEITELQKNSVIYLQLFLLSHWNI